MASVLIADDEPDVRFLLRRKIEAAAGLLSVVGEAASGEEAVEAWRRLRPDAIVLDHRMPGLTGLEAAAQILAEDPGQVIVLFSAFSDGELERACAALGIRACVAKADLPRVVDELLEHLNLSLGTEINVVDPEIREPPEVDITETPERSGFEPE
jgi:CheY-like chemotaxis protein